MLESLNNEIYFKNLLLENRNLDIDQMFDPKPYIDSLDLSYMYQWAEKLKRRNDRYKWFTLVQNLAKLRYTAPQKLAPLSDLLDEKK